MCDLCNFLLLDNQLKRDLSVLWDILRAMSLEISEDLALQFEHDISLNQDINTIAGQFVDTILLSAELEDGVNLSGNISSYLRLIHGLPEVLRIITRALDLTGVGDDELDAENGVYYINMSMLACYKM